MLSILDLETYRKTRNRREGVDPSAFSMAEADSQMHVLLSHTMEELMELQMCVNRKSWKPLPSLRGTGQESIEMRLLAIEELADVLLMLDAFRDMAGFTLEQVQEAVLAKMAKNLTRQDHVCNVQQTD